MEKFPVVTICVSMRNKDEIRDIACYLSDNGFIVLEPYPFGGKVDLECFNKLRERHHKKIDMSDLVYVFDKDGYIGESVNEEIRYAKNEGIDVLYHSKTSQIDLSKWLDKFAVEK